MRFRIQSPLSLKKPPLPREYDTQLRAPEADMLSWFTTYARCFAWEYWERHDITGYRARTEEDVTCTIRLYRTCIYGNGNTRWQRYGIIPNQVDYWYYVQIRDPHGVGKRKSLLDFAASPKDVGHDALHLLHAAAKAAHEHQVSRPVLPVEANACLRQYINTLAQLAFH